MDKAGFAALIDAYADAKTSGNKYLIRKVLADLEPAINALFEDRESEKNLPAIQPEVLTD